MQWRETLKNYDIDKEAAYPPPVKRVHQLLLHDPLSVMGISFVCASFGWGIWKGIQGQGAKSVDALGGRSMLQAATVGAFGTGIVLLRFLQQLNSREQEQQNKPSSSLASGI